MVGTWLSVDVGVRGHGGPWTSVAFVWFNVLLQPSGGVEWVEVCVGE